MLFGQFLLEGGELMRVVQRERAGLLEELVEKLPLLVHGGEHCYFKSRDKV